MRGTLCRANSLFSQCKLSKSFSMRSIRWRLDILQYSPRSYSLQMISPLGLARVMLIEFVKSALRGAPVLPKTTYMETSKIASAFALSDISANDLGKFLATQIALGLFPTTKLFLTEQSPMFGGRRFGSGGSCCADASGEDKNRNMNANCSLMADKWAINRPGSQYPYWHATSAQTC